ncbi:MAG: hypothetical protein A2020_00475 [Lentisphaerae bacterium GWF2_45_14]|nr:MAG: hypothetical protein A2020_00475 [Lentisphaerae bacterium GWF2_45_14]
MDKNTWFVKARFGLFLHWGIYAIPAKGEWTYANDKWKPGEYEGLINEFNPVNYDPALWAELARKGGMKYVVFTTRHHDGFCMFDSHYTDYKITNTPYGKDTTRMLTDAFRAAGLRVGFYHSLPDWTHPGYADQESPEYIQRGELHTPTAEQYRAYVALLYNHVEQLMTEYGKIDLLFLDYTSKYKAAEDYFDRERLLAMIYKHQPKILVNDRLAYYKDNVRDFDYYTPEICVPNQQQQVKGRPVLWETCATMNDHWGYCRGDENYKPLEALICGLAGCVSRNGNLLLNIGPDETGRFPAGATTRLKELSKWMKLNGESIHGAGKSEFQPPHGGIYTQKKNYLYLHLMQPPLGDIILPQLFDKVEKITLLRDASDVPMITYWGGELLKNGELRIRPVGAKAGDVLKIKLNHWYPAPNRDLAEGFTKRKIWQSKCNS